MCDTDKASFGVTKAGIHGVFQALHWCCGGRDCNGVPTMAMDHGFDLESIIMISEGEQYKHLTLDLLGSSGVEAMGDGKEDDITYTEGSRAHVGTPIKYFLGCRMKNNTRMGRLEMLDWVELMVVYNDWR